MNTFHKTILHHRCIGTVALNLFWPMAHRKLKKSHVKDCGIWIIEQVSLVIMSCESKLCWLQLFCFAAASTFLLLLVFSCLCATTSKVLCGTRLNFCLGGFSATVCILADVDPLLLWLLYHIVVVALWNLPQSIASGSRTKNSDEGPEYCSSWCF